LFGVQEDPMQIITTHKGSDFDAMASVLAAKVMSEEIAVLPRSLNPNVKAFLSIDKDIFDIFFFSDEIELDDVTCLIITL
jgi:tRNA nucleotidyltransferase (CCA-adding enzyme)